MRLHVKRVLWYITILFIGSLVFDRLRHKLTSREHQYTHKKEHLLAQIEKLRKERNNFNSSLPKTNVDENKNRKIPWKDILGEKIKKALETSSVTLPTKTMRERKMEQMEVDENQIKNNEFYDLHTKLWNKISDQEVIEYYSRERESENKFNKTLDIKQDRELLSTLFPSRYEKSDRVTDQLRVKFNVDGVKKIIVHRMQETTEKLKASNCNIDACEIISRQRLDEADVIVYKNSIGRVPRYRKPHQTIVWFQIESALNYKAPLGTTIVNWTATYRHDSVLNTPYERFTPFLTVTDLPNSPIKNFAKGKQKLIAWFVSNCSGQRMSYVQKLKKYINVDVFGHCGEQKCERKDKSCFAMLKSDYKFYLSFENTHCGDYITEKLFWNAYKNDIVPVVMGAHENDYKRSAPPKSFIHVDWFESPQQLANYLNFLDQNDDFYNSYFLWKGTGEFINTKFVCRLCAMAHLAPHFPMWYNKLDDWWSGDGICKKDPKWKQPPSYLNAHNQVIKSVSQVVESNDNLTSMKQTDISESNTEVLLSERQFVGDIKTFQLHKQLLNKITDEEVIEFYSRERESEQKFNKVLDIKRDRELLSTLFPSRHEKSDRVTDQLRVKLNVTETKKILIVGLEETNDKLKSSQCNVDACDITLDQSKFDEADVIVFRSYMPIPKTRKPHQAVVWFQIESAGIYAYTTTSKSPMNWTATYRHDSVLNTPYERFTGYLNVTNLPVKPQRNYAKGKKKLIAWFVSNCNGNRMEYVKELKKYIQVDVYGPCGDLTCNRWDKSCFAMLKKDYKFYLSFENSQCTDYITEKLFWNAYENDVVPIVLGAHQDDYKRIAPPRSFIHVDWFKSPQQLANYLKFLDQNDDFYNSYFSWKGTGEFINTKFVCRLCAMAHLAPHFPMWYNKLDDWWKNNEVCAKGFSWNDQKEHGTLLANKEIVYGKPMS